MKRWMVGFAVLVVLACVERMEAAVFIPLGDLPGGLFSSQALGVSVDGSVVVGQGYGSSGEEAFRWSLSGGMEGLGELPGGVQASRAEAVSSDGSVVVGQSDSELGPLPFRWTREEGMVPLDNRTGHAYGVSADGAVVVGVGTFDDPFSPLPVSRACRWSLSGGMEDLGDLPGYWADSEARAVSANGSVVVGFVAVDADNNEMRAFRWTEATGMEGPETGGYNPDDESVVGAAYGVSDDGLVVVGRMGGSDASFFSGAFRWTEASGAVWLDNSLSADFDSAAYDTSADGSIVVGMRIGSYNGEPDAFIWDASHGVRNLGQLLVEEYGLDLTGWKLCEARSISADGNTIVGYGIDPSGNTQAWLVNLTAVPEPSSLVLLAGGVIALLAVAWRRRRRR